MSTALYRRYRPETFADVIGQEHVTEPLMTALEKNRVNHAYLFSGPRGCGKTTSARILARCLNCAEGPTPTPCGVCDSCRELSRDGGGSLDVIEMDAASHGGVDHARDLRERASFAPVRDRYKIFIIDEAHMVTREGFNALLKIVEEPPEHIKFIFATTEPNKVLGTIRSRTHHYPFRLVPPETLTAYLQKLADEEGVKIAPGVLQLVVRAGGGSVRDSLSILDQLIAGASDADGVTYDLSVALLGFTHGELLDEVIEAFASNNAATLFGSVDRVIQTGQDPRRFIEDLLERLRDLIIIKAVPDAAEQILHGASADHIERLRAQADKLGAGELSRAADITNTALNEMSGATNPQLHLELLCARIMLPTSDQSAGGFGARLDRIERRISGGDVTIAAPSAGASAGQTQGLSEQPAPIQGAGRAAVQAALNASRQAQGKQTASVQGNQGGQQAVSGQTAQPQASASQQAPTQEPTQAQNAAPLASQGNAPLAQWNSQRQGQQGQGSSHATAQQQVSAQNQSAQNSAPNQATQNQAQNPNPTPAQQAQKQQPTQPAHPTQQTAPQGENVVQMVLTAWHDVIARVQSPVAQQFLARCTPSKFENGQLYIRATMPVLRQVKDHIGDLESALNTVLGLQVRVRAEVDKGDASQTQPAQANGQSAPSQPQPGAPLQNQRPQQHPQTQQPQNQPAQNPAQQQQASSPQQNEHNERPQNLEIAEGPRSGEAAWAAHGQPRTQSEPQWSQDDWNNPVTSWDVASIPQSGEPAPASDTSRGQSASEESEKSQPTQESAQPAPEQSNDPEDQLSQGAANGFDTEDAHEQEASEPVDHSTAQAQREQVENATEDTQYFPDAADEATADDDAEDTEGDSHPAAAQPVEPEGEPVADGTTATDLPDSVDDSRNSDASDSSEPQAGQNPKVAETQAPARPIAEEYGDYEGGYFDEGPQDEPEYIAGVGYVSDSAQTAQQSAQSQHEQPQREQVQSSQLAQSQGFQQAQPAPAVTPQPGAPLAGAPLAGGRPPLSNGTQGFQGAPAQPQVAPAASEAPASAPAQPSVPGKKLSFRERHAAQFEAGRRAKQQNSITAPEVEEPTEFVPSDEDTALEETVLMGQKAIEQILGGKVIEETSNF